MHICVDLGISSTNLSESKLDPTQTLQMRPYSTGAILN